MKSEPMLPFDEIVRGAESPAPHDVARPFQGREGRQVGPDLTDEDARRRAVDPTQNIVLEASAGTGKTRVLVERYVNLLRAGVEPDHILAMTFTRKAAAEMRQRIIDRLEEASRLSEFDAARWRELKARLGDIAISTIDAFCLSLLREFPLEADVDPGFDLAADTDIPRLVEQSLDRTFRICRAVANGDEDVALVFAQLGERRLRAGIAALLDRRLVAPHVLRRFLQRGPRDLTAEKACDASAARLRDIFAGVRDGLDGFLDDGPIRHPQFAMLADDIRRMCRGPERPAPQPAPNVHTDAARHFARHEVARPFAHHEVARPFAHHEVARPFTHHEVARPFAHHEVARPFAHHEVARPFAHHDVARPFQGRERHAAFRHFIDRLRAYFLTQEGKPRGDKFAGTPFKATDCCSDDAWKRHRATAAQIAEPVADAIKGFRRDLNAVMSRGVWRIFAVALHQYQRTLDAHALLDFSGVLERAVKLLKDLDEFAESRLRLEARYRHVLVDEFQDTSRAQWDLVLQLVRSWGEGFGAADDAIRPSIFIVGDRKQSIYGFRDADVSVVDEAAAFIEGLRPESQPRQAITVSFRAAPEILSFVNDVFEAIARESTSTRRDAFRYDDRDRFPAPVAPASNRAVGFIAAESAKANAELVGDEIVRLLSRAVVRDRTTGVAREAQPADIAILFRSRDSHRDFESALERRGVSTYVYKGLGFFDADEIQDAVAVLRYLVDPLSDLRAAALLRSRVVRLSDAAIAALGRDLASVLIRAEAPQAVDALGGEDRRVLDQARRAIGRWLSWVDRLAPSEILDRVMRESAYAYEIRGTRSRQARENLKKLRAMIRRAQNRGYQTLARIADHLERLAVGDESNAAIDASDAVSLMTVHAAKGLEFPIVFVVNMGRGTGGVRPPIRVSAGVDGAAAEASVSIADYQSEADEEASAREREETKRLLYVALTRARDRLYLSASVENGVCRTGRGSLGEVLPASVKGMFVRAAACAPPAPQTPLIFVRQAATTSVADDFA